jgi:hypothetical protein
MASTSLFLPLNSLFNQNIFEKSALVDQQKTSQQPIRPFTAHLTPMT